MENLSNYELATSCAALIRYIEYLQRGKKFLFWHIEETMAEMKERDVMISVAKSALLKMQLEIANRE